MNRKSVDKAEIIKRTSGSSRAVTDLVAVEEPLEIRLGYGMAGQREQKSISVTMRTPGHDFELVVGFLFTEGIISSYEQITAIKYCHNVGRQEEDNVVRVELDADVPVELKKMERHFYTSSSCGVCSKSSIEAVRVNCPVINSNLQVAEQVLNEAPVQLRKAQSIFEHTGGLHASGIFNAQGNLVIMREDVGRHNALDKLIGAALAKKMIPLSDYFVLVSGRASFELVQKSLVAGIPMMAAVGAPSSMAVTLANDFNMTLLGFVKEVGFNIYCGEERLILKDENKD